MELFTIKYLIEEDDGLGGIKKDWIVFKVVEGYIDLLSGDDYSESQNAFTEDSTHILIVPNYQEGITDNMRVTDSSNRFYHITYADNPMNQNHHNEIYLKFGGVADEI